MNKRYSFLVSTLTLATLATYHQSAAMDRRNAAMCLGVVLGASMGYVVYKEPDFYSLLLGDEPSRIERYIQHTEQFYENNIRPERERLANKEQEIRDLRKSAPINAIVINRLAQEKMKNKTLVHNKAFMTRCLGTSQELLSPIIRSKEAEVQSIRRHIERHHAEVAGILAPSRANLVREQEQVRSDRRLLPVLFAQIGALITLTVIE